MIADVVCLILKTTRANRWVIKTNGAINKRRVEMSDKKQKKGKSFSRCVFYLERTQAFPMLPRRFSSGSSLARSEFVDEQH